MVLIAMLACLAGVLGAAPALAAPAAPTAPTSVSPAVPPHADYEEWRWERTYTGSDARQRCYREAYDIARSKGADSYNCEIVRNDYVILWLIYHV
ncbi:hypothetical protein ACQEVB_31590 [Pseudonocardia sp. CA-107938]|uniref:hypothetical protein n=1 Tax=Pseudonocardia sp. CA-107938 TaxID=3240021 RepID=UPI003D9046F5